LVRDAAALETLAKVDTLVLDKTGTLTEGRPRIVAVAPIGVSEADLLQLAASVERGSEHPLAAAVLQAAAQRQPSLRDASEFKAIPGKGVRGLVDGRRVFLGTAAYLAEQGISSESVTDQLEAERVRGRTLLLAAIDRRFAGWLAAEDPVRDTAAPALEQ